MSCGCNIFVEYPSGGISFGGSATVSDSIIDGGIAFGGSAYVDLSPAVWDGMEAVWPLDESGDGTSDEFRDRTRNELHATGGDGSGDYVPTEDVGIFCLPSQLFDDTEFITIPRDGITNAQGFSVSMWVKINGYYLQRQFFSRGFEAEGASWVFTMGHTVANHLWAQLQVDEETILEAYTVTMMQKDKWYHLGVTWEPGSALKVYINGTLEGTTETEADSILEFSNSGFMGRWNQNIGLEANLMDVRLHPVTRSADWLLAEHDNYCSAGFFVVGETEEAIFE